MPQPAPRTTASEQPPTGVPEWIVAHPAHRQLSLYARAVLAAIAAAGAPDAAGNLIDAVGGAALCRDAGVSRSTFWRHVRALEGLGFVTCIQAGGKLGGRRVPNVWGVPGRPGALEHRRHVRALQRMAHRGGGVFTPVRTEPGDQATLYPADAPQADAPQADAPQPDTGDSVSVTLPPVSGSGAPCLKNGPDGYGHAHGSSPDRPDLTRIRDGDLADDARLLDLFAQAVARSHLADTGRDRHRFFAAAEYARRIGRDPARLFASIVWRGLWGHAKLEDEDAGAARLRARRRGQAPPPEPAAAPPPRPALSDDARFVAECLTLAHRFKGDRLRLFRAVKKHHPDWTRDRWDAAVGELEDARAGGPASHRGGKP